MQKITYALFAAFAGLALAGCGGSGGSNSNVAQAEHTAPIGMWGGALAGNPIMPATLNLTAQGGHFSFACNQTADLTQQVVPDSSGHFSVAGTSTVGFTPLSSQPTQFTGTVTNHVMTVTLTVTPARGTSYVSGSYTVTLGQAAPIFQGACPG